GANESHREFAAVIRQRQMTLGEHLTVDTGDRVPGIPARRRVAGGAVRPGPVLLAVEPEVEARGAAILEVQQLARSLRGGEGLSGQMAPGRVELPGAAPRAVGGVGRAGGEYQH